MVHALQLITIAGGGRCHLLTTQQKDPKTDFYSRKTERTGACGGSSGIGPHQKSEVMANGTGKNFLFATDRDRKSTRLNSSHVRISYAVFCLKKKKKKQ